MSLSRIFVAAALAVSLSPALSIAAPQTSPVVQLPTHGDCGYVMENGRYVFLGSCVTGTGDNSGPADPDVQSAPPT
ncbi:hypothetical protein BH10PSE9_BH10PSE9_10300 [soil metagenome]